MFKENETDVVTFMKCQIVIPSQDMSHGVRRGMSYFGTLWSFENVFVNRTTIYGKSLDYYF